MRPSSVRVASRWSRVAFFRAAGWEDIQPSDRVKVFHGTRLAHVFDFINGFDANKVKYRHYGGPRHAGLFVTPSEYTAERFADRGEIILEIETQAKNLHGTDYSGNIGRHQGQDWDWTADKYPDSFRPYLSLTMLQSNEPQGLLRGLVKPSQIKRIRYKPYGGSPKWYSRADFLKLGLETVPAKDQPYGKEKPIRDIGWDLSNPRYTLDQFLQAMAASYELPLARVKRTIEMYAGMGERGRDRLEELIDQAGFGPTATRAFIEKLQPTPSRVASWVKAKRFFPGVRNPVFHATSGPRAANIALRGEGIKSRSGFSNFGPGNVDGSVSMSRDLNFLLRGGFGNVVFVLDLDELRNRFSVGPHAYRSSWEDEYEERLYTDKIPASMIRGVILRYKPLQFELDEWTSTVPFPVAFIDRDGSWGSA
jgi:hypothetical protein